MTKITDSFQESRCTKYKIRKYIDNLKIEIPSLPLIYVVSLLIMFLLESKGFNMTLYPRLSMFRDKTYSYCVILFGRLLQIVFIWYFLNWAMLLFSRITWRYILLVHVIHFEAHCLRIFKDEQSKFLTLGQSILKETNIMK